MKPNGTARVIMNLSAPLGNAVNEGIDGDLFPAVMSSTSKWLEILDKAGRNCLIMKVDWANAYKHIPVHSEDLPLQYFNWMGKDFIELMLIFGAVSSAGLFDDLAKVILDLVTRQAHFPRDMIIQYLDDVCAAAGQNCPSIYKLEHAYRQIAADIGVNLAPNTDPDKAFSPTTKGTVLGVEYNTVSWTWSIPLEKLARVLNQLRQGLTNNTLAQHELWSLVGRLIHYAPLIPCGRYNIDELLKARGASEDRNAVVLMTPPIRRQLYFWWLMLKTTNGLSAIPPPALSQPGPWSISPTLQAAPNSH